MILLRNRFAVYNYIKNNMTPACQIKPEQFIKFLEYIRIKLSVYRLYQNIIDKTILDL